MAKPMYYWNGTAWEAVAPVVPQSPIAYQASAPSSPSTGDLWIDSDQDLDSYQRQLVRYLFNPSAGATSVSGVDANGATLSYTPGAEQVYLNGALLVRGSDYVATNGTSITSLAALSSGDVLEVFAYVAFNPANTYTQSQVDGLVGLVHLHTESFTSSASVSVNNVFSATYDNYRIKVNTTGSADTGLWVRLRVSGTDNSSSNYKYTGVIQTSGTGPTRLGTNGTTQFDIGIGGDNGSAWTFDLEKPFATDYTKILSQSVANFGTDVDSRIINGIMTVTTSYTGFTIAPLSGTLTGSIEVYGYK